MIIFERFKESNVVLFKEISLFLNFIPRVPIEPTLILLIFKI